MILDDERVGELDAEPQAEPGGRGPEPLDERDGLVPGRVALERGRRHPNLTVAQHVVQQAGRLGRPEQHGIQLDRDVQAHLAQQELDDVANLGRRAAVEGAQRERVGDAGRVVEVAPRAELVRDLRPQPIDRRARVEHAAHERAHARAADAGQVVADAHVVDGCGRGGADRHLPARGEHRDEHRRLHVLLERLLEREFLRPFDVVADRLRVDARARDREGVVDLDGLQLDDAPAAEPGQHDVLGELRLRPGRRAEGRRGAAAVHRDRHVLRRRAGEELAGGKVENRLPLVQLAEHAADERVERIGTQARHDPDTSTLRRALSSHGVSRPLPDIRHFPQPGSRGRTVS